MNRKILIALSALVISACALIIGVESLNGNTAENTAASSAVQSSVSAETASDTADERETAAEKGEGSTSAPVTAVQGTTSQSTAAETVRSTAAAAGESSTAAGETTSAAAKTKTTAESTTAKATAAAQKTTAKSTTQNSTAAKTTTAKSTASAAKKSFEVSISISCKNALSYISTLPQSGYFLEKTTCTVTEGDTVFDLLSAVCKQNSISLTYQSVYYIQGIGGLCEKDCTSSSGWMYRVNGTAPAKAACNYSLSAGDTVEWYYVTSAADR